MILVVTLGESGRSASAGPAGPAPADTPSPPSKAEGHKFRGEAEEAEGPSGAAAFLVAFLLLCFLSSHRSRIAEKCVLFEAGIMAEGENMETRQK